MEYGGFWIRVVAYIIDCIVVGIVFSVALFVLISIGVIDFSPIMELAEDPVFQAGGEPDPAQAFAAGQSVFQILGITSLVYLVIYWLYEAVLVSSPMQATPGKMAVGLRITDLQGQPIGFGRATGRFVGKLVSRIIAYIGFIMAAFSERKQSLHDMMAGTLVVRG